MYYSPDANEKKLFNAIVSLKTRDEAKKFFRDLLTEAELKEFANRWQVAQMLDKKVAYKEIEKQTHMSSTTIARIQKWLTAGMGGYRLMLKRMKKEVNNTVNHHATPDFSAV